MQMQYMPGESGQEPGQKDLLRLEERTKLVPRKRLVQAHIFFDDSRSVARYKLGNSKSCLSDAINSTKKAGKLEIGAEPLPGSEANFECDLVWEMPQKGASHNPFEPGPDHDHYNEAFRQLATKIRAGQFEGDIIFVGDGDSEGLYLPSEQERRELVQAVQDAKAQGRDIRINFIFTPGNKWAETGTADQLEYKLKAFEEHVCAPGSPDEIERNRTAKLLKYLSDPKSEETRKKIYRQVCEQTGGVFESWNPAAERMEDVFLRLGLRIISNSGLVGAQKGGD